MQYHECDPGRKCYYIAGQPPADCKIKGLFLPVPKKCVVVRRYGPASGMMIAIETECGQTCSVNMNELFRSPEGAANECKQIMRWHEGAIREIMTNLLMEEMKAIKDEHKD